MAKKISIDLHASTLMQNFLSMEKEEVWAFHKTLNKISKLTWDELYKDKGIRWESIPKYNGLKERVNTFRFSKKYRASAIREGDILRVLDVHTDHDSAYD